MPACARSTASTTNPGTGRALAGPPGDTERARFSVAPYGFASSHDKKSATAAFKAFVRSAVERHGCGDLCLPA